MISTERVLAYSRLEPEAPLETKPMSSKPPPDCKQGLTEEKDILNLYFLM